MDIIDGTTENYRGFEVVLKLFESLTLREKFQFLVDLSHQLRIFESNGNSVIEFKPTIIINKINKVEQMNAILGKNAQIKKNK